MNNHKLKIKVLGIGHTGCRIIEHLICDGFDPQSCIFVSFQEKEFTKCEWPNRIYLWKMLELIEEGKRPPGERHFQIPRAVISCEPQIRQMLMGADLALIAAGMESAEEMVAAPCLADVCHTTGTMVFSVCSLLSLSENRVHSKAALESVKKLRIYSDLTLLISRDGVKKLFKEQKDNSTRDSLFHFEMARSAVQTLADIFSKGHLTLGSFIQGGLRQIALPNTVGQMGFGFGDTLAEAAQNALSCPLIEPGKFRREISLAIAKLKVAGDVTVTEVSEALDILEGVKGRAYPLLVSMEKSDIFASEAILFGGNYPLQSYITRCYYSVPKEVGMDEKLKTKLTEDQSVLVLLDLMKILKKEGFKMTQVHPFFAWIRRKYSQGDSPGNADATKIYVTDMAIPQIAPFDMAYIEIQLAHFDRDYFYLALTICFHSIMQGLLEAEEFNEVMSKHDELWMPRLVSLFQPAEMDSPLKWDTEYDDTIEDTLYGYFPLSDKDRVIAAVRSINSCLEAKNEMGNCMQ